MKWITKVGGDVFNLMANSVDIAKGIKEDLDMELLGIGLTITDFRISEFTYPENIPVSYTHLDVYKRQEYIPANSILREFIGGGCFRI